jgi:hypothetical protein
MAVALAAQPSGTKIAEQPAAGGGTIWLLSSPEGGSTVAPFADGIDRVAQAVAARF